MLIYCERKTLLNDWLILADKIKRTGLRASACSAVRSWPCCAVDRVPALHAAFRFVSDGDEPLLLRASPTACVNPRPTCQLQTIKKERITRMTSEKLSLLFMTLFSLNLPIRHENKNLLLVWPSVHFRHLTVLSEG
jgi:hypothetical protein